MRPSPGGSRRPRRRPPSLDPDGGQCGPGGQAPRSPRRGPAADDRCPGHTSATAGGARWAVAPRAGAAGRRLPTTGCGSGRVWPSWRSRC
jgi:hypothetical protein